MMMMMIRSKRWSGPYAGPVASHIRHRLPLRVKLVNTVYRDETKLAGKRKQSAILEPVAGCVAWPVDACGMQ